MADIEAITSPLLIMDKVCYEAAANALLTSASPCLNTAIAGTKCLAPCFPGCSLKAVGPLQALEAFGDDIAIAFSGAEDVALVEYAHLTGRPFRVFRWISVT